MKGTEKQVAWAEAIKKVMTEGWAVIKRDFMVKLEEKRESGKRTEKWENTLKFVDELMQNDEAKFWIDNFSRAIKPREIKTEDDRVNQLKDALNEIKVIVKEYKKEKQLSGLAVDNMLNVLKNYGTVFNYETQKFEIKELG